MKPFARRYFEVLGCSVVGALLSQWPASLAGAQPHNLSALDVSLRPERDALIGKIARGVDYEANVERFEKLLKERQERRAAAQGLEAQAAEQKRQIAEGASGLDAVVGEHCGLSADPKAPPINTSPFMRGDWGKVIVKEQAELRGRNVFDKPEPVTLYKVQGQLRTYVISSKGPRLWYEKPFVGSVGDLVLVCSVVVESHGSASPYPPDFRTNILSQGFVTRIKDVPLIAHKKQYNPIHLLKAGATMRSAVHAGAWPYPIDKPVVARVMVKEALGKSGGGKERYLMEESNQQFLLDVPSGMNNQELLKPYRFVWVVMGQPTPDLERKTWLLSALDIEARYANSAD